MNEIIEKIGRLRELMDEKGITSTLITRRDNFSWITGGAREWVSYSGGAVAWILVTPEKGFLVSNNIESRRLMYEEIEGEFELIEYRWYEDPMRKIEKILGKRPATDGKIESFLDISEDLKKMRIVLDEWEMEKARKNGKDMQRIFEDVLIESKPDMTELDIAGRLREAFTYEGFELPVLLVFSEETRKMYRHNLPTDRKLGRFFFVSICAQRRGIVLSMTRSVAFGRVPDDIKEQHELNALIDSEIISETKVGRSLGEMFEIIREIYEKHGYAEEFEKHHQGGLAGYNPREEKALPGSKTVINPGNLVAWNPTITGTKSEDTFLIFENGIEMLTFTENTKWPVLEFDGGIKRPGIKIL